MKRIFKSNFNVKKLSKPFRFLYPPPHLPTLLTSTHLHPTNTAWTAVVSVGCTFVRRQSLTITNTLDATEIYTHLVNTVKMPYATATCEDK